MREASGHAHGWVGGWVGGCRARARARARTHTHTHTHEGSLFTTGCTGVGVRIIRAGPGRDDPGRARLDQRPHRPPGLAEGGLIAPHCAAMRRLIVPQCNLLLLIAPHCALKALLHRRAGARKGEVLFAPCCALLRLVAPCGALLRLIAGLAPRPSPPAPGALSPSPPARGGAGFEYET